MDNFRLPPKSYTDYLDELSQQNEVPPVRDVIAQRLGLADDSIRGAQEVANQNRLIAGLGEAADQFGNAFARSKSDPTFYQQLRQQADQPVKDLLDERKVAADSLRLKGEQAKQSRELDLMSPTSRQSKVLQDTLKRLYPNQFSDDDIKNVSAADMELVYKPLQLKESIEARKQQAALMAGLREQALDAKKQKESQLTDKQTESVNEFDQSLATTKDLLAKLGKNKSYVGPVDGRVPEYFIGGDETAFRAELGRMSDAYRKLITGAGASNQELKRLESRLPQATDSYENFTSKAKNFIQEVDRNKGIFLENLAKKGKRVDDFRSPGETMSEDDKQAIEWATQNPQDPRSAQILQLHGMK